jgi:DNA-binding PadR family transcriptional regulator
MAKDYLKEFEHHVLLALLQQGHEGYSVPIIAELEERTGREVAPAAVYITLKRLEQKGFVGSELRTAEPQEGGRERRYYTATDKGREQVWEARRVYMNLWEGLEEG